ncbi:tRNA (cytidine/uridine-2'-O-)-methyltransferase [Bacilli bacterium PM5-3]|nr:tRNA (cytidine/uridine-2'-O-)-methyltransferase [Bacilli bacterium PM5-3]MDH6603024.1 tRNA (cytidine/uridine-2'-O-)-methyltransferase [Bacilli bacterium PM5-9]
MPINVVLYEPEIPQNTGNIIRTCVATNTKLHLIEPLGFDLYKKDVRRSTANHLDGLDFELYSNFNDFKEKNKGTYYFLTRYGKKPHSNFDYSNVEENIYLIFGKESSGIPYDILKENLDTCLRIPMSKNARSLNLSNCVSILVYEVLRQQDYFGLSMVEVQKGEDFLEKQ